MAKTIVLNEHLEFKKTSVHSKDKLQDIKRYLEKFLNSSPKPLNKFNENDLNKFLNSLTFKIRTINDIKAYLKVFIKWYFPDWSSRFRNLDKICKAQKPNKAYQPEQMISLNDFKKIVNGEKDLMYKVYWLVMFYGGFRPSEACNLEWNQIELEGDSAIIKLHTTKTNRDFYKALPREATHLLKEWKSYNSSSFVFPSPLKEDCPIIARSVCARLKRLSKKTLGKEVVPYCLRHSIATILYDDDTRKDDDTAQQLGHNKSMKEVYMNLNEEKLKSNARKLWLKTKPLTKEENDKIQILTKQIEELKKQMELISKGVPFQLLKNPREIKNFLQIMESINKEFPKNRLKEMLKQKRERKNTDIRRLKLK